MRHGIQYVVVTEISASLRGVDGIYATGYGAQEINSPHTEMVGCF
jgi:hypothetical protein